MLMPIMEVNARLERRVLQFSALSALAFAAVGVGFGAWIGSLVIMFDGAYSLVSVGVVAHGGGGVAVRPRGGRRRW